jgi:hypothetical protein
VLHDDQLHGEGEDDDSTDLGQRSQTRDQLVRHLVATVGIFVPDVAQTGVADLLAIANEAYELADQTFGMQAAVDWAQGFVVPPTAVAEDVERLRAAGGCLVAMARKARESRASNRLSAFRVDAFLTEDNPEKDKLRVFGREGVRVPVGSDFTECGSRASHHCGGNT